MLKYAHQEDERIKGFIKTFTPIRFNRYPTGTIMRQHYDHIHSIFDGQHKGIPILSMLGVLNDDYEGGEFMFSIPMKFLSKLGDIMVFPSNFMYPHEVKEVTKRRTLYLCFLGILNGRCSSHVLLLLFKLHK